MKRLIVLAALLVSLPCGAHAAPAQYQTYDNETQLDGGAYAALSAKPAIIAGITQHCARIDRTSRKQARATKSAWETRNAGYAPLLGQLRTTLRALAKRENKLHEWRAMNETMLPVLIQTNVSLLVAGIDAVPADERAARCADVLRQIDEGRMDLSREPAGLGEHIEKRRAEIAGGSR